MRWRRLGQRLWHSLRRGSEDFAPRRKKSLQAVVIQALLELFEDLLVLSLHESTHAVFGERGVILAPLGRQNAAFEEEVGKQVGVGRPRILGLHVEDSPSVAHVVVVPEQRAASRLAHQKPDYSACSTCAKIGL